MIFRKQALINQNSPDAVVTVTDIPTSAKPFSINHRGHCAIKEGKFTAVSFQAVDGQDILPGQPHSCLIRFPASRLYPYTLWVGRQLKLYEGKYLIATMVVQEIRNTKLDRNLKYQDQEDILQDHKLLNVALRRSLEWGRKFAMPLDNKLMKSLPALSGTDIGRVAEYVTQVREDVLWNIYYANWDTQEEMLKIDVKKAVAEKYPWISKGNLASLDVQGMYYAWHG